jgi:hypothetical protein
MQTMNEFTIQDPAIIAKNVNKDLQHIINNIIKLGGAIDQCIYEEIKHTQESNEHSTLRAAVFAAYEKQAQTVIELLYNQYNSYSNKNEFLKYFR